MNTASGCLFTPVRSAAPATFAAESRLRPNRFWTAVVALSLLASAGPTATSLASPTSERASADAALRFAQRLGPGKGFVWAGSKLLWTGDDGARWTDITPATPDQPVQSVFFLDERRGWSILGDPDVEDAAIVARTVDSGRNWETAGRLPSGRARFDGEATLVFVDERHGWLLSRFPSGSSFSNGGLVRTTDGGQTWEALPEPPSAGRISFASPTRGWLAGGAGGDRLFSTADGGRTWRPETLPGLDGVAFFDAPVFRGPHGLLAVTVNDFQPRLAVFATGDGGDNWTLVRTVALPDRRSQALRAGRSGADRLAVPIDGAVIVVDGPQAALKTLPLSQLGTAGVSGASLDPTGTGWLVVAEGLCSGHKTDCSQSARLLVLTPDGEMLDRTPPRGGASITAATVGRPVDADAFGEPADASAEISTKRGFDKCAAGTLTELQTWWDSSPFWDVNAYIGGVNRGCNSWNQSTITSGWVTQVLNQGWKLIPTWVGLQAPSGCSAPSYYRMSSNPGTAASEAYSEANNAADAATTLGLAGTIVYLDMENYNTGSATCNNAVRSFVDSWVQQMQARGFQAGVYANVAPLNQMTTLTHPPDAVWIAQWVCASQSDETCYGSYTPSVFGIPGLNDGYWGSNQRLHQYRGDHNETWGGLTFNIDSDISGGPVVGPSSTAPPAVTTLSPSSVGQYSATLNASVDPNGSATTVYFDYGRTTSYGSWTTVSAGSGSSPTPVNATVSGLQCGAEYHVVASASNSQGWGHGSDVTFFTSACPASAPTVTTQPASSVGQASATLNGTVNPNGSSTTVWFEYGLSASYGSSTSGASAGSGSSTVPFNSSLSGLDCGRTYHFRARATNSGGPGYGSDRQFQTSSCGGSPSIQLTWPLGGETLEAGSTYTIRWTSQNLDPTGTIQLNYWDGNPDWGLIGFASPSTTQYSWTAPSMASPVSQVFIGNVVAGSWQVTDSSGLFLVTRPTSFYTVAPCRAVDTRSATLGAPALAAGSTRRFTLAGTCGIPASARAVSANLTVTVPSTAGNIRAFPATLSLPGVSSLNYSAGQTRGNNAMLVLGANGAIDVFCSQGSGTAHFVLDVTGYLE